jgi:hypothetical protein
MKPQLIENQSLASQLTSECLGTCQDLCLEVVGGQLQTDLSNEIGPDGTGPAFALIWPMRESMLLEISGHRISDFSDKKISIDYIESVGSKFGADAVCLYLLAPAQTETWVIARFMIGKKNDLRTAVFFIPRCHSS